VIALLESPITNQEITPMSTITLPTRNVLPPAPVEVPAYDDRLGDVSDGVLEALLDAASLLGEHGEEAGDRSSQLGTEPRSTAA
jgi:hypothetical protein